MASAPISWTDPPYGSKRRRVWRGGNGRRPLVPPSALYRIIPLPSVSAADLRSAWTIGSVRLATVVEGPRAPLTQLEPQGLLDDSLLEFFCRFIERYNVPTAIRNNVFCFNSYFYTKLLAGGDDPTARHAQVSRWTNRLGNTDDAYLPWPGSAAAATNLVPAFPRHFLWEKDVIIVPVNLRSCHWAVVLICFPYLALRRGKALPIDRPAAAESSDPAAPTDSSPLAKNDDDANLQPASAAADELRSCAQPTHATPAAAVDLCVSDDEEAAVCDAGGGIGGPRSDDAEAEEGLLEEEEGCCLQEGSKTAADDRDPHCCGRPASGRSSSQTHPAAASSPYFLPNGGSHPPSSTPRTAVSLELFDHLADFASGFPREEGKPVILHLDSLSTSSDPPEDLRRNIVSYLSHEFHSRQKDAEFHLSTADDDWLFIPDVQLPTQANAYDCGVFLLEFLRFLFVNPPRLVNLLRQETARHFAKQSALPPGGTPPADPTDLPAAVPNQVPSPEPAAPAGPLGGAASATEEGEVDDVEALEEGGVSENGEPDPLKRRRSSELLLQPDTSPAAVGDAVDGARYLCLATCSTTSRPAPKVSAASAFWFTQDTVALRRICLRQMLLFMASHPYWQTDQVMTSNRAEFLLQSSQLGHLRDLLNCHENSPIAGAVLRANALGRFAVVLPPQSPFQPRENPRQLPHALPPPQHEFPPPPPPQPPVVERSSLSRGSPPPPPPLPQDESSSPAADVPPPLLVQQQQQLQRPRTPPPSRRTPPCGVESRTAAAAPAAAAARPPPYTRPRSLDRRPRSLDREASTHCSTSRRPWQAARSLERDDNVRPAAAVTTSRLCSSPLSQPPPPPLLERSSGRALASPPARRIETPPPPRRKPTTVSALLAGRSLAMDAPPRSLFLSESRTPRRRR